MTKPVPQIALDEQVIDDPELEKTLEDRELAKGAAGEARKKLETVDEIAKGKIGELKLRNGKAVRIGRFRVAQTPVAARSVSFETKASSRLKITTLDEEAA
jgi:hypothetical protein